MFIFHDITPKEEHIEQIKCLVKKWKGKLPFYLNIVFKKNNNNSCAKSLIGRVEKKIVIKKKFLTVTLIQDKIDGNTRLVPERHEHSISIEYVENFWPTSKEDAEKRIEQITNI